MNTDFGSIQVQANVLSFPGRSTGTPSSANKSMHKYVHLFTIFIACFFFFFFKFTFTVLFFTESSAVNFRFAQEGWRMNLPLQLSVLVATVADSFYNTAID